MNKDKQQKSEQNNTEGTVKRLRHKIDSNVIMFTLQKDTVLRVCVYDERKPSEIYEEVFIGDCLPHQARNMFQSMGEMFEFLEMNFAGLVSLKEKQAIVVDLNKLKIPIKFELPFRLNVYPIVEQVLQSVNRNNEEIKRQLGLVRERLRQEFIRHLKERQQLSQQIIQREKKINGFRQQLEDVKKYSGRVTFELIQQKKKYSQLQLDNLNLKKKIDQLQKRVDFQLQQHINSNVNINSNGNSNFNNGNNILANNNHPVQVNNNKTFDQKPVNNNNDQLLKEFQLSKSQPKKHNPFLNGLFTRTIPSSNNSLLSKINSIPSCQNSRFYRFIEKQPNNQLKLNISKKLIKDSDLQQIVNYNWSDITRLNLSQNLITGHGLETLFQIKWPSLKSIVLSANKITDFNLQKVNFSVNAPNLFLIDLNFNNLSSQMFKKLVEFTRNNKSPKIYFNGIKSDSCIFPSSQMGIKK